MTCALLVCMLVMTLAGCIGPPELRTTACYCTSQPRRCGNSTADQPTARIPQPPGARATGVQLMVRAVTNPAGQGLVLRLAVEDSTMVEVENVSLYPASQPGVFSLGLPMSAADLVHQEPTVLIVTVYPAQSGTTLQPGVSLNLTAEFIRPRRDGWLLTRDNGGYHGHRDARGMAPPLGHCGDEFLGLGRLAIAWARGGMGHAWRRP